MLIEHSGVGVLQILLAEKVAMVSVTKAWYLTPARRENLRRLCETLESRGVKKAILLADGVGTIGHLDVSNCRANGLPPIAAVVEPGSSSPADADPRAK